MNNNDNDSRLQAGDALRLSARNLGKLSSRVLVPTYDRAALRTAITHLGVGGFHRAHQALYLDELAQRGISYDWGECGIGLHSRDLKEALEPQDWLYTVVERDGEGATARVVGSIADYLFAPDDPEAVLRKLADSATRLVTMTITKEGYNIDMVTGDFKPDTDEMRHDGDQPRFPTSALGYLCEALARRRAAGLAPFTVLSCDNLQDNGGAAKTALVSLAAVSDPALAVWIEENVAFPSSMVDRITPATKPEDREMVAEQFGVDDRWPVATEPFSQWIVQDVFCNGRPPLEEVGVTFVTDVHPYETVKTRLLNASHSAIGYLGMLAGYERTDEVLADARFQQYLRRMMDDEVTPLLPVIAGFDIDEYKRTLLRRFANPKIADPLTRLSARGSVKVPTFLLPSINEALDSGRSYDLLCLAVAGWFYHLRGRDGQGAEIEIQDPNKERLQQLALAGGNDPRPLLGERDIFDHLGQSEAFAASLERALRSLDQRGLDATLDEYLLAGVV